jgi:hypothetical protein
MRSLSIVATVLTHCAGRAAQDQGQCAVQLVAQERRRLRQRGAAQLPPVRAHAPTAPCIAARISLLACAAPACSARSDGATRPTSRTATRSGPRLTQRTAPRHRLGPDARVCRFEQSRRKMEEYPTVRARRALHAAAPDPARAQPMQRKQNPYDPYAHPVTLLRPATAADAVRVAAARVGGRSLSARPAARVRLRDRARQAAGGAGARLHRARALHARNVAHAPAPALCCAPTQVVTRCEGVLVPRCC